MKRNLNYYAFLAPRFWGMWVVLLFARLIAALPIRIQYLLGSTLGWIAYRVLKSRRQITEVNIRTCFPELPMSEQTKLVKDCFKSNGIGVFESLRSWFVSPETLRDRTTLHGQQYLDQALAKGKGVILLGGHYSTLDLVGSLTTLYFKSDVVQRDHSNPLFNAFMTRSRGALYGNVISKRDLRGMVKSLKNNHVVWYATDQDYGYNGTCFARFFGQPCSTLLMTMRLAKMSGATVIPFSHFRKADKIGYDIYVHPPLDEFPSKSAEEDAQRLNTILETEIRKAPAQYLWMHRRFKTPQKKGEKNIYQLAKADQNSA